MISKKQKNLFLEQLTKTPIVQFACEKTGISRASYYRWRKDDPAFALAANEAIDEGVLLVNDLAESKLISAIKNDSLAATKFWLQFRHKAYSRPVIIVEKPTPPEASKEYDHEFDEILRRNRLI